MGRRNKNRTPSARASDKTRFFLFLWRIALCFGVGLGVRLGYGPLDSHWLGLLAPVSLLALLESLAFKDRSQAGKREGPTKRNFLSFFSPLFSTMLWGWVLILQLVVHIVAFPWIFTGLRNIGHMGVFSAGCFFVLSAVLIEAKLAAFVFLANLFRARVERDVWLVASLAVVADGFGQFLFPWHWGNLAAGSDSLRQLAVLPGGVHFVSFVFWLEAWIVYILLGKTIRAFSKKGVSFFSSFGWNGAVFPKKTRDFMQLGFAGLVVLVSWTFGVWQLQRPGSNAEGRIKKSITVALMQPSLEPALQRHRGDGAYAGLALNRFFELGLRAVLSKPSVDLLIAPESAVPFYSTQRGRGTASLYSPTYHAVVAMLSRIGHTDVIYNELVGHPIVEGRYYNAASLFSFQEAKVVQSYYKRQLIPFGEYLPGESRFSFLRSLFSEVSRYLPGTEARLLTYRVYEKPYFEPRFDEGMLSLLRDPRLVLRDWPVSPEKTSKHSLVPLICYEGVFPGLTYSFFQGPSLELSSAPDFLVNLSNDVWFGAGLEDHQHALAARLRAVETGRYLIRANMSGLSAVYDTKGRIAAGPLRAGRALVLKASVPLLSDVTTPCLRYGPWPLFGIVCLILGLSLYRLWKTREAVR